MKTALSKKLNPSNARWLPPLLSRVTLATAFLVSGAGKFRHLSEDVSYFRELGIPKPEAMAPFVAGTEVACGSLLLLGLFTRLASAPLIPIMAVALATARKKDFHSFSELTGVYEFSYALLLSYLMTEGPGAVSVERLAALMAPSRKRSSRRDPSRRRLLTS